MTDTLLCDLIDECDDVRPCHEEENAANTKTLTVYAVVAANALVALAVIGVFYLVYSR